MARRRDDHDVVEDDGPGFWDCQDAVAVEYKDVVLRDTRPFLGLMRRNEKDAHVQIPQCRQLPNGSLK